MEGGYDSSFQMWFWRPVSASLMFYRETQPWDGSPKSLVLLDRAYLSQRWEDLPEAEDKKLTAIAERFESLEALEAALREVSVVEIQNVSYNYWGNNERVWFERISHVENRPVVDVSVHLEEEEFDTYRGELIARDEQAMTEFLQDGHAHKVSTEEYVYSRALGEALNQVTAHSIYRVKQEGGGCQVEFIWEDAAPYVEILETEGLYIRKMKINLPKDISLEVDWR